MSEIQSNSPMSFSRYAPEYDRMAELNPAYQANLELFRDVISRQSFSGDVSVCDVGAGTGNYICEMGHLFPSGRYIHIDSDPEMNRVARNKYASKGYKNVEIVEEFVQRVRFDQDLFDVIICVHSLYAMHPQNLVLKKLHSWLKPGGALFIIDFGRKQNVVDWGFYIFSEIAKRYGYWRATRELFHLVNVTRENANTTKGQETGAYWTHSTEEFNESLKDAGFAVEEIAQCYRGYSDLAICRKLTSAVQYVAAANGSASTASN